MMNTSTATAIPRFEIKINPQTDSIKWGDVVWVDFGNEAIGSELKGVHPAVVIQNNVGNSCSPCTMVAPMTSKDKPHMPTHIVVYPTRTTGLTKTSMIMFEQIKTIDKSRILSKVGHLDAESLIRKIENSLSTAFDRNLA